ncbi:MAG: DUF1045 domain-containing protein [Pseudomonadota bacterium]
MLSEFKSYAVGWVPSAGTQLSEFACHARFCKPFQLTPGTDLHAIEQRLEEFAADAEPVHLPRLTLRAMGNGLYLRPSRRAPEAYRLMAETQLAMFPSMGQWPSETPRNLALRVGTLTGTRADIATMKRLDIQLEAALRRAPVIEDLALLGDLSCGRGWQLIERYPLIGSSTSRVAPDTMTCLGPPLLMLTGLGVAAEPTAGSPNMLDSASPTH